MLNEDDILFEEVCLLNYCAGISFRVLSNL